MGRPRVGRFGNGVVTVLSFRCTSRAERCRALVAAGGSLRERRRAGCSVRARNRCTRFGLRCGRSADEDPSGRAGDRSERKDRPGRAWPQLLRGPSGARCRSRVRSCSAAEWSRSGAMPSASGLVDQAGHRPGRQRVQLCAGDQRQPECEQEQVVAHRTSPRNAKGPDRSPSPNLDTAPRAAYRSASFAHRPSRARRHAAKVLKSRRLSLGQSARTCPLRAASARSGCGRLVCRYIRPAVTVCVAVVAFSPTLCERHGSVGAALQYGH